MTSMDTGQKHVPKASAADPPPSLVDALSHLQEQFMVDGAKLKQITNHFVGELQKGLERNGATIPMNPTWVMSFPTGDERGTFLALDMGGTNLRVCEIRLLEKKGEFDMVQSKYKVPERLKTGNKDELWDFVAECVQQFIDFHHQEEDLAALPLGFTFSYPATQDYIDHGVLQRWTKGFDVDGVEGHDVVPQLEAAMAKRKLPVRVAALINDTSGTLIASAYTDPTVRIGCIFGTGYNAAYIEDCGSVPKLRHLNLPPDMPIVINCEYGAFDNEHLVLPRTRYDVVIDESSPRPGQQSFEKMIAGLYLGEIFRLVLLDLHDDKRLLFQDQDVSTLRQPYTMDSSFLSQIEQDLSDTLSPTRDVFESHLGLRPTQPECQTSQRIAEMISTRAARLSACGIAAICKKKHLTSCHVGADGSVFTKMPHFKARGALALREILDWNDADADADDPIVLNASEDGSGVGAALIAALTIQRVKEGNLAGIRDPTKFEAC